MRAHQGTRPRLPVFQHCLQHLDCLRVGAAPQPECDAVDKVVGVPRDQLLQRTGGRPEVRGQHVEQKSIL